MRDKSLDIFLMMLFGIGGITILILAWARPMPLPERILTTSVGSIGLFGALIRVLLMMSVRAKINMGGNPTEAEARKKPS